MKVSAVAYLWRLLSARKKKNGDRKEAGSRKSVFSYSLKKKTADGAIHFTGTYLFFFKRIVDFVIRDCKEPMLVIKPPG